MGCACARALRKGVLAAAMLRYCRVSGYSLSDLYRIVRKEGPMLRGRDVQPILLGLGECVLAQIMETDQAA